MSRLWCSRPENFHSGVVSGDAIDDPVVYERPWTISMPLTRVPGYEMYEYACHEENRDVGIYLGGGRVDER